MSPKAAAPHSALIVDDDKDVLEAVKTWLEEDFLCTTCVTVAGAMAAGRSARFDLALVDYRLPDGRGLDLIKALKDLQPHLAVIFMTGYGDYSVAAEAVESGAATLLEKPFHRQKLQSAAQAAMVATGERNVSPPGDDRVDRVLKYIRDNMASGLREKQLLTDLGFSRSAFHVFFRDNVGMPFRDYVARERIKGAKYFLTSTTLGAAEVARRLGLRSSSYFTAWFRGMTGVTPLEYRRNVRAAGGPGLESVGRSPDPKG